MRRAARSRRSLQRAQPQLTVRQDGNLVVMSAWFVTTFAFLMIVTSLAMVFMTMTFVKTAGKGA
jgi:hypothetical protein